MVQSSSEVCFGWQKSFPVTALPSKAKAFLLPSQTHFLCLLALPWQCCSRYRQAQVSPRAGSQLLPLLLAQERLLCQPHIPPNGWLGRKGAHSEAAGFETGNITHVSSLSRVTSDVSVLHAPILSASPQLLTVPLQPQSPAQLCLSS